jgi:hypothetical protein
MGARVAETATRISKGEIPIRPSTPARKSVAGYIVSLIKKPWKDIGGNVGINKPGTDGDRPTFM